MNKTILLIIALSSLTLCTNTPKPKPTATTCGEPACAPTPTCYVPSCGFEAYCSNQDFFGFFYRKRIKKLRLKNKAIKKKMKQMKKLRKQRIAEMRKKMRQMRKKRRQMRKQKRKQKIQLRKALKKKLKMLRKQRRAFFKKFKGKFKNKKKCGYGCGGKKKEETTKEDDGDDKKGDDKKGDDKKGDGKSDLSSNKSDDGEKDIDKAIGDKKPIDLLRKKCDENITLLSQFLNKNKDKGLKDLLLYGDSDECNADCENNYSDIYGTWIMMMKNLKEIYKRKLKKIKKCENRKKKMREAFLSLCRPYSLDIRQSFIKYYDFLLGRTGCGSFIL
jgi:hypothetical protein